MHASTPTEEEWLPRLACFAQARLQASRFERGVLSSKAVGEPPLLLSASAHCALQAAVRAGRAELGALGTLCGAQQEQCTGSGDSPKSVLLAAKAGSGGVGANARASAGTAACADPLRLPANVQKVKAAVGSFDVAAALREAAQGVATQGK